MIEKGIKWLQTPHPFRFTLGSVVVPGVISFLVILTTAPFGFRKLLLWDRVILGAYFGLVGSIGVHLTVSLFRIVFKDFMDEDRWTIGKEIILILSVVSTICLLNFGSFLFVFKEQGDVWKLFQVVVLSTAVISIFPVIILVMYEQYHHQKAQRLSAERFTRDLMVEKKRDENLTTHSSPLIVFESEQGKVEAQLDYRDILFIKSEGNYLEIFYLNTSKTVEKALLRNRLKAMEAKLPTTHFFRCHKSYIVNLSQVQKITGNARNYELHLKDSSRGIPVSRSKSEVVMQKLKGYTSTT